MKEFNAKYKVGDEVDIYIDYQNKELYEGSAKIVEIISEDLPFIIDSTDSDNFKVYSSLKCKVKWIKSDSHKEGDFSIRRVRFLKRIGYRKYEDEEE